jgi:cytochrome c biogenesis protein CcmG/thiol:disulfide interchange protein DsbE
MSGRGGRRGEYPPSRMRRLVFALIGLGLVAVVVIGLAQKQGDNTKPTSVTISAAELRDKLAGAPAPLAALHAQANQLLGGGKSAFAARLTALRGHPVVVNKWGSWCVPCRQEFPFLQQAAVDYGKRVAFVGLDAEDNHQDAAGFLERFPVSYPSYEDPRDRTVQALKAPKGLPFTMFYDASGALAYVHQGGYATRAQLEADIRRYALGEDA